MKEPGKTALKPKQNAKQPKQSEFSFGAFLQSGFKLATNLTLIQFQSVYFFYLVSMFIIFGLIVAASLASGIFSLLTLTLPQAVSYLLRFGFASILAFFILAFAFWIAYQWFTAFMIGCSKVIRLKKFEPAKVIESGRLAASSQFKNLVFAMVASSLLAAFAKFGFQVLFAVFFGSTISLALSALALLLVSASLMFTPMRAVANGSPAIQSVRESIGAFSRNMLGFTLLWIAISLIGFVIAALCAIPFVLGLFGLAIIFLSGGMGFTFWLVLILCIPALFIFCAGLSFSTLFSIGALEHANSQIVL